MYNKQKPVFNMIAAYSVPGRVLGDSLNAHGMPWGNSLKNDLRHFAELTDGNTLIVGAKTLPFVERLHDPAGIRRKRNVIVIGGSPERPIDTKCIVKSTLNDALMLVGSDTERFGEAFVAGGARTYAEALQLLKIELQQGMGAYALFFATEIHGDFIGDITMPELGDGWIELQRTPQPPDTPDTPVYDFVTYRFN